MQHLLCELRRPVDADAWQEDRELVPAKPRHGVRSTERVMEARTHPAQYFVTDVVAEGVVDVLEAIQVEQEDRQRAARPLRREQGLRKPVLEQGPVGQVRKAVPIGKSEDLALAFRDGLAHVIEA